MADEKLKQQKHCLTYCTRNIPIYLHKLCNTHIGYLHADAACRGYYGPCFFSLFAKDASTCGPAYANSQYKQVLMNAFMKRFY